MVKSCRIRTVAGHWLTKPMASTLSAGMLSYVPYAVNHASRLNYLQGVAKRNLPILPNVNNRLLNSFRNFVRLFVRKFLNPLQHIMSFEDWLAQTKYTNMRKEELRRANAKLNTMLHELSVLRDEALRNGDVKGRLKRLLSIDSFIKREFYDVRDAKDPTRDDHLKMARIINSRSDMYKCLIGPVIASIEHVVFKLPWFIKHVPEDKRADYITNMLGTDQPKLINGIWYDKKIYATDYTSFEASIGPEIANACEQQLFKYMLCGDSNNHTNIDLYKWLQLQLCTTTTTFSGIQVQAESIRMSGEMNTSLGNGFTNLMLMMFMVHNSGDDYTTLQGVFEGDDGLTAIYKPIDMSTTTHLGFVCKLEIHDEAELASFCGRVYSRYDSSIVGDPVYYLASAGWSTKSTTTTDRTRDMLTMAKGLSYCHAFRGSPIIPHLGRMLINSVSITPQEFNAWFDKTTLIDAYDKKYRLFHADYPFSEPTPYARSVCWRKFGIHPTIQLLIEHVLLTNVGWINMDFLEPIMPRLWRVMWSNPGVTESESLINSDVTYAEGDVFAVEHFTRG